MNITRLFEPSPERPRDLPQCEWNIHIRDLHYKTVREKEMARKGKDPKLCSLSATYRIGPKCYCAKHAGRLLLALSEKGRITINEE